MLYLLVLKEKDNSKITKSELIYRTLFDKAADPVLLLKNGKWIDCNTATLRVLGYNSIGRIIGESPSSISPKLQQNGLAADCFVTQMVQIANETGSHIFDWEFTDSKGGVVYTEVSMTPVVLNGEHVMHTSCRNISERKRVVKALYDSEIKYKKIVNTTAQGFVLLDRQSNVIEINEAFTTITGYDLKDVKDKTPFMLVEDQNADKLIKILNSRGDGLNTPFEFELKHKSGKFVPVMLLGTALYDGNGEMMASFAFIQDISARIESNTEIRKLSTVVDQNPASIIITDIKGKVEYVNPEFERISGYTYHEVVGKNARILKSGYHHNKVYANLWKSISEGKIWRGRLKNRNKFGETHWESVMIAPIKNNANEIINFVGVKQDISEQKRAEEALEQSERELKEAVSTKNKFFSIIAHDLKGPFNTLLGFSELLLNRFTENTHEENLEMIQMMNVSSKKTYNLVNELLTWARLQMGKMKYLPEVFNIQDVVAESVSYLEDSAVLKGIEIVNKTDGHMVYADREAMKTVIRNLVSNAIKYSSRGNKVTIISEPKDNRTVLLKIIDKGVGIAPDKIQKLFRIDQNVSTPGTDNEQGTGLGLILCKEFVTMGGQDIFVESKFGDGTTMGFTIAMA